MAPPAIPGPRTSGNEGALFEVHQRAIWRYLRALGCAPDVADDLVQETFLKALDGFEDRGPEKARRYLRSVARFLFLRTRRDFSLKREVEVADAVDRIWAEECEADSGDRWIAAVRSCVAALPDAGRRAVEMEFFEGRSRKDMESELGLKPNGLKTLMQRIRARLRECVKWKLDGSSEE